MRLKMSSAHTSQITSPKTGFKFLKNKPKLILNTPDISTIVPWEVVPYSNDFCS